MKNRECFGTDGRYTLYPITEDDRENYVELHRQLNGDRSLFLNPICKDMMWEQVLSKSEEIYSIFDETGRYCGSLEFQKPNTEHPEVGIELL